MRGLTTPRRHRNLMRGTAVLTSTLTVCALLATGPAPVAAASPPASVPAATKAAIEAPSSVVAAVSCEPVARAGAKRLGKLLAKAYPRAGTKITRTCSAPAVAEQRQGRVVSWRVSVGTKAQRAQAADFLGWLGSTDSAGNRYANLRRLGVARIVWDDREWRAGAADLGWQPYSTCAATRKAKDDARCGRSAMQIVLSWAGARGVTSYWTGRVAAEDFGPCRPADLSWAYRWTKPRTTPCPARAALPVPAGATALDKRLIAWSGSWLHKGSTGTGVRAVQQALGVKVTGRFTRSTRKALKSWQGKHGQARTGQTDQATWRTLLKTRLGSVTTPTTPTTPPAGTSSDVPMPASSPTGWQRIYSEDFVTAAPMGSFLPAGEDDWRLVASHPYANSLRSYPDGWGTTGDLSVNYASRTTDVVTSHLGAHGVLRLHAHTDTVNGKRRSLAASFFPVIDPGANGMAQVAQTYGRYSVRFRTVGGYHAQPSSKPRYGSAFLLWPNDDRWSDGEVDFPEMAWGNEIAGYVHKMGDPIKNAAVIESKATTEGGWHVATIEWRPTSLTFFLDGQVLSTVTHDVPRRPFRWGFQSGGHNGTPPDGVEGQLLVDWITIDKWVA